MASPVSKVVETPLTKAIAYASLKWAILPIRPGSKLPLLEEWQNRATSDIKQIREWWQRWPHAGIGVHCGLSGLVVVDIDPRNGGKATFSSLEAERSPLWDEGCAIARTGRGGSHYVFMAPEGVRLPGKLGPGVDLLHGNHYFIVEPSVHPVTGRRYTWERDGNPIHLAKLPVLPDAWCTWPDASPLSTDPADALTVLDPREPRTSEKLAVVREALAAIDPDCDRDTYVHVLMGLQSTGWEDWQQMAEEWASGLMTPARTCDKYNERAFASDCRKLQVDRGITLATVLWHARQAGWKDPRTDVARHDYHGDADNGARFARKHRGQFLFVHSDSVWLRWDGLRWAKCERGEERIAARQIALEGLDDAQAAMRANPTDRTRNDWQQATAVFRNEKRHEALLRVASTEPGMSIGNPGQLDTDPMLLGVRNGVVNLKVGTLLTADPDMLVSRQAGAAFDRGAQCPQWITFLNAVFEGDADMVDFVQRAAGYAITGNVEEEKMFFLFGSGANGKSVFANVLHAVFGDYAVNVRSAMLTRDLRGQNSEGEREKIRLPGARLALINEVGSNDLFDDARLKELVARDPITARALYGESYQFNPTHTIFLRGNHQPGAVDSGDAFWRRMVLIPFNRQFAENERIPDLERRILDSERGGVLAWIVDGCLAWQRSGLRIPRSIRAAVDEYRRDTDLLGEWLEARCKRDRLAETLLGVLYDDYCGFLREAGVNTPSRSVFGRQIQNRGFRGRPTNGKRLIAGLSLLSWDEGGDDGL